MHNDEDIITLESTTLRGAVRMLPCGKENKYEEKVKHDRHTIWMYKGDRTNFKDVRDSGKNRFRGNDRAQH